MNISIRNAVRSDAVTIVRFNAAMADETEHKTLDLRLLHDGVNGLFDHPEYGFYILAESDGEIVGQIMITYEWSDWRNGVFWWIQSVYVKPEFRSRGVFRMLFDHISSTASGRETVCGFRLYVERENERAQRVYEAMGMKQTRYEMYEKDFSVNG